MPQYVSDPEDKMGAGMASKPPNPSAPQLKVSPMIGRMEMAKRRLRGRPMMRSMTPSQSPGNASISMMAPPGMRQRPQPAPPGMMTGMGGNQPPEIQVKPQVNSLAADSPNSGEPPWMTLQKMGIGGQGSAQANREMLEKMQAGGPAPSGPISADLLADHARSTISPNSGIVPGGRPGENDMPSSGSGGGGGFNPSSLAYLYTQLMPQMLRKPASYGLNAKPYGAMGTAAGALS